MFAALTRVATGRAKRVAVTAALFAVFAGVVGAPVAGLLTGGGFSDNGSQSADAARRLEQATGVSDNEGVIALVRTPMGALSPAGRAAILRVAAVLRGDRDVVRVSDPLQGGPPSMISGDGRSAYVIAGVRGLSSRQEDDLVTRLQNDVRRYPSVVLGGQTIAQSQVSSQVSKDLARAETLAFPILFILLIIVFRGVVAALLPLMVGGLNILTSFLVLRAVNAATPLSIFALNVVTGIGLGLAIDYSLLVISRYREEMRAHGPGAVALGRTLQTAGRTIAFSSLTVAGAGASLLVFPERFLYSMGIGAALTALSAAAVALIVLPAVLMLLGARIDALAPRRWRAREAGPASQGGWYRLAHFVMRRPVAVAVATAALLLVLGLPFLGIRFTSVDASVLPASFSARQVSDALARDFPPHHDSPVRVAVSAPASAAPAMAALAASVSRLPQAAEVSPPRLVGPDTWEIDAVARHGALDDRSRDLVTEIRSLPVPYPAAVGGQTAVFVDLEHSLGSRLPYALGLVALLTIGVLFVMTGSALLPVKSVLMNALSLSAAFGILVWIFQDGHLQGVFGFTSQGALESTQPILLFALAFGLSTDYGVFLLTRIKEAHDGGLPTQEAVAVGLERTGRIVTAAALLFTIAIGSFATSQIIFIKEVGVGTALAVLIDASIVRALLVPALMRLLHEWNWWAPHRLRDLRRRLRLDRLEAGAVPARPAAAE